MIRCMAWPRAPGAFPAGVWALVLACGCGDGERTRRLSPLYVGMTDDLAPIYDDGDLVLYAVSLPVELPVLAPSDEQRRALREGSVEPFGRYPWVRSSDIGVQLTWTLSNLDAATHDVEVLVDPWNEFGRYRPGFFVEDNGDVVPNRSGIQRLYVLRGLRDEFGDSARVHGTFNFADLDELATDFATAINIMESGAAVEGGPSIAELVNHTFHTRNRSGSTPLTDGYRPDQIPALTGFDIGLRTRAPANIAIEVFVEVVDRGRGRVVREGDDDPRLRRPDRTYSIGGD